MQLTGVQQKHSQDNRLPAQHYQKNSAEIPTELRLIWEWQHQKLGLQATMPAVLQWPQLNADAEILI